MSFNASIQMLTLAWNEKRFNESKSAYNAARRSVFRAATILLNSELKILQNQNDEIRHEINRCQNDLQKYDNKLQMLDNMTQLATQSLEIYFQARMENLRTFVTEQCHIISDGIQEEADHWKEIHTMLQQKLVVPGDLRSYGGGNGLPRAVKQSPNFSQIVEEEEEEKETDVSTLLQSRTLTPLITQTLKKARLLASKLSQNTSLIIPSELNISKTVHEETLIEEPPITSIVSDDHVTLRDVSAIEKAIEIDHNIPNPELSISLLPYILTTNIEEEKQNNKSIASTISDKTFVKTSLKQFSSDEETDDDDDDDTIIEESFITDNIENTRPLLLTADRSIRRLVTPLRQEKYSLSNQLNIEKIKFKQEKISFQEPLHIENNQSDKTLLLSKNSIDIEKSNHIRSTIIDHHSTSKLSPIKSANSNDDEEKEDVIQQPEKNLVDTELPTNQSKINKSPIVEQIPIENPTTKRRTTRRTTIRLLRENQNDNLPLQPPIEIPTKTRYATRYSTRLAATVMNEGVTISRTSTMHRRITRFTSE
ncbi:unnamed protein product [Rotaria sordida]|uniref:Uncharacterized protein n=1 Tax=Rotaria sordida TaxID=392033 RepID=A0A815IWI8_9BILA|nr:unnamed protein product [Rotaria sordida]CAF1611744.1 unnamed protein product [Rotaria sordida]